MFEQLLSGYLDKSLSADQSRKIQAHLEVCPDCRATMLNLREVETALKSQIVLQPDGTEWESFGRSVFQKIESLESRVKTGFLLGKVRQLFQITPIGRQRSPRPVGAGVRWAAAVASVVFVGVVCVLWLKRAAVESGRVERFQFEAPGAEMQKTDREFNQPKKDYQGIPVMAREGQATLNVFYGPVALPQLLEDEPIPVEVLEASFRVLAVKARLITDKLVGETPAKSGLEMPRPSLVAGLTPPESGSGTAFSLQSKGRSSISPRPVGADETLKIQAEEVNLILSYEHQIDSLTEEWQKSTDEAFRKDILIKRCSLEYQVAEMVPDDRIRILRARIDIEGLLPKLNKIERHEWERRLYFLDEFLKRE